MVLSMHRYHLLQKLLKARDLLFHVDMMSGNNVFDQATKRAVRKIRQAAVCRRCEAASVFQSAQHIVNGKMRMYAGIAQRFSATAAIVDTELLKSPGRIRDFYC